MAKVQAHNYSIVLNSTSYFEVLLENILLRRIGKCVTLPKHLVAVLENYRSQITRANSLSELKKHFRMLFGKPLSGFLGNTTEDLLLIDKFYVVRHVLAHGSRLPTLSIDTKEGGSKTEHEDPAYLELIQYLQKRYHLPGEYHCDIIMFLMFSAIIDDFSRAIFAFEEVLVNTLVAAGMVSADTFWGDFASSHTYCRKI